MTAVLWPKYCRYGVKQYTSIIFSMIELNTAAALYFHMGFSYIFNKCIWEPTDFLSFLIITSIFSNFVINGPFHFFLWITHYLKLVTQTDENEQNCQIFRYTLIACDILTGKERGLYKISQGGCALIKRLWVKVLPGRRSWWRWRAVCVSFYVPLGCGC